MKPVFIADGTEWSQLGFFASLRMTGGRLCYGK